MGTPGSEIARRLAWEVEAAKSFEFRVHHDLIAHRPSDESGTIDDHYIETAPSHRIYSQEVHSKGGDQLYVHYQDGERFANEAFERGEGSRQTQIVIQRSFGHEAENGGTERPWPFKFYFVGATPLQEALPSAKSLGKKTLIGRDCEVFLFEQARVNVAPLDAVYTVDRATGIPLEVRYFRDEAARRADRPVWVWTAESFDEVQGHHWPLKSVEVLYDESAATPTPTSTRRLTMTDVHYDRDYPAALFWPQVQPGATVWDKVKRTSHVEPGAKVPTHAATTTAFPLRAEPPRDWGPMASWLTMGLGATALIIAAIGWRRGR